MPFTIHGYPHTQNLAMESVGIFLVLKREATVKLLPWHAKVQSLKL